MAIDLFHMPSWDNIKDKELFLNMVDLGTNFQMIERLPSKEAQAVWKGMSRTWGRFLGWPTMIVCDQGTEFLGTFRDKCHELGILLHQTGARAPHQNGRCERHGALWKMMFERAKWINAPASLDEWKLLIRETEAAKNRLSDRSGYSPAQRMLGQTPRISAELHSDSWLDPVLASGDGEMLKILKAKAAAQRAWAETNCSTVLRKALRARPRTQKMFKPGDVVYVWRHKAWEGPGVVILPEGANCYVNVKGRMWKVANDHLRDAVSEEIKGTEAVHEVFRDLRDRFSREGREGQIVLDLTGDPRPPERERAAFDPVQAEGDARGLPRLRPADEDPEPPVPLPEPEPLLPERPSTPEPPEPPVPQLPLQQDLDPTPQLDRESTEEPEVERHSSEGTGREDAVRAAVEAANQGRRLDGVPMIPQFSRSAASSSTTPAAAPVYQPVRPTSELRREDAPHPYQRPAADDVFVEVQEECPVTEFREAKEPRPSRDYWELLPAQGVLRRHHLKWRTCCFSPWEGARMPVDITALTSERVTVKVTKSGDRGESHDDWRALKPGVNGRHPCKWKGFTDFTLSKHEAKKLLKEKKSSPRGSQPQRVLLRGDPVRDLCSQKGCQRRGCRARHPRGGVARVEASRFGRVG